MFLAAPTSILNDLGLQTAAENAVLKLLAALPTIYRADAEAMRQRLHIDLTGWTRTREDVSCLPVLQEAVWHERKLTMLYQAGEGKPVERVVDPVGPRRQGQCVVSGGGCGGGNSHLSRVKNCVDFFAK